MSPIRKVGDFQSVEISSWDDFVQEEIAELQARGELDDLPHQGKPINIWKTELNPEYDLAFSRLKNAGILPLWMELDQDIARRTEELEHRLSRLEHDLRAMLRQVAASDAETEPRYNGVWERVRSWMRGDFDNGPSSPTLSMIIARREQERRRFLELVEELDQQIVAYHDSLPQGGEHLQRLRWLPGRGARLFDGRIRLADWWEEYR